MLRKQPGLIRQVGDLLLGDALCSFPCTSELFSLDHACSWGRSQDRPGGAWMCCWAARALPGPQEILGAFKRGCSHKRAPL